MIKPQYIAGASPGNREGPTFLPLAVTIGLLVSFVTGAIPGGLTGTQGFFFGAFGLLILLMGVSFLTRDQRRDLETGEELKDVTVTRSADGSEIVIRIHFGSKSNLDRKVSDDR